MVVPGGRFLMGEVPLCQIARVLSHHTQKEKAMPAVLSQNVHRPWTVNRELHVAVSLQIARVRADHKQKDKTTQQRDLQQQREMQVPPNPLKPETQTPTPETLNPTPLFRHTGPPRKSKAGLILISRKVSLKSFCRSQLPHESVNLSFTFTGVKN